MRRGSARFGVVFVALAVLVGGQALAFVTASEPLGSPGSTPSTLAEDRSRGEGREMWAASPLHFEPNLGQWAPDVRFKARASGYEFYLTGGEAVFVVPEPRDHPSGAADDVARGPSVPGESSVAPLALRVIRLQFVDASPSLRLRGDGVLPSVSNYFLGNDPARWATGVSHFAKVVVEGVWPGVDVVFYGTPDRAIEYDFIVAPGADPSLVKLQFGGASVTLEEDGGLSLNADGVQIRQEAPFTYQSAPTGVREVKSRYALDPQGFWGVHTGEYDEHKRLVIDPVVLHSSSFMGGASSDEGQGVDMDASGNAYVVGATRGSDFPTQAPYQQSSGGPDAFVAKFWSDGTLAYSTYLGGPDTDEGYGIAVDSSGSAYLIGQTRDGFPTYNASQATYGGSVDTFVARLAPGGNALVFSTYLGGTGTDYGRSIALDPSGNAYVTGSTTGNFPTANGFRPWFGGGYADAFVAKLGANGNALLYSTYLGGSESDEGYGIAVDQNGRAFVTGSTRSTDFPTTLGAFQSSTTGEQAAFVTKLGPGGDALVYSTYLRGSSPIQNFRIEGRAIALDSGGSAYVAGKTDANLPVRNAFQRFYSGNAEDAFVTKFTPNGDDIVYSTYLGGTESDRGHGIAVDSFGNAYITGTTLSVDFPLQHPHQQAHGGGHDDAFAAMLTSDGSALAYGTYLGGGGYDSANGIAVDAEGSFAVAGWTQSTNFPTQTAYQPTFGGATDVFLTRWACPCKPAAPESVTARPGPAVGQITVTWNEADGTTAAYPVTTYHVHRSTGAGGPFGRIATTNASTRSFTDTGLPNGATYHYTISAVNVLGEGPQSGQVLGRAPDSPSPPRNLTASRGPSPGQIGLQWQPPADDGGVPISAYRIYRASQQQGPFAFLGETPNVTSWSDEGLPEGALRCYHVAALNVVGEGGLSGVVCQKAPERPSPPLNVRARPGGLPGHLVVEWDAPADSGGIAVTGYTAYRTTIAGSGVEVVREFGDATFVLAEEDRVPGVRYYYQVTATNGVGEGARGSVAYARAAALPRDLDHEGDMVPDVAESVVCGVGLFSLLFETVNGLFGGFAYPLGRCSSTVEYVTPATTFFDRDEDLAPDVAEPVVCLVENKNMLEDGFCVDEDWGWPP